MRGLLSWRGLGVSIPRQNRILGKDHPFVDGPDRDILERAVFGAY